MNLVQDAITLHLPSKQKTTPSGWTSFNAPCCHHNGTSADTDSEAVLSKAVTAKSHIIALIADLKQDGNRVEIYLTS